MSRRHIDVRYVTDAVAERRLKEIGDGPPPRDRFERAGRLLEAAFLQAGCRPLDLENPKEYELMYAIVETWGSSLEGEG